MFKVHLRMYNFYSLWKHFSHSHTKLYEISHNYRLSHSTIYLKCHACRSHPLVSYLKCMLSYLFEVSCHWVMLSSCSQGHACTMSLIHTLSPFSEDLLTKPTCTIQTSTKLHYTVSALSDHVLLPRITLAWGFLLGSLHYTILGLSLLTIT